MAKVEQILKNLTYGYSLIPIHSVEDGVKKLDGKQELLEAITLFYSTFNF